MFIVEAVLEPERRTAAQRPNDSLVADVFWPLSRLDDHLEHLTARARPDGTVAVLLLVGACDGAAAVREGRALCERVSTTAPIFAGWTVARCDLVRYLS